MFENLRWAFAYVDNFNLAGLSLKYRIIAAAVSCGIWAIGTFFGVVRP